jgi:hypothetical protein
MQIDNATSEVERPVGCAPLATIVLEECSMKAFKTWCSKHHGQQIRILLSQHAETIFVVDVDKIVFDERLRFCTLPTIPTPTHIFKRCDILNSIALSNLFSVLARFPFRDRCLVQTASNMSRQKSEILFSCGTGQKNEKMQKRD